MAAARRTQPLSDRIPPHPRVLFVGINPGMRSAAVNHHYAGHSNRFWRVLHDAGLTPVPLAADDDARMMEWGYGLTNLIARPTPGIDTLSAAEYADGLAILRRKVRRVQPRVVAFIGITLFRYVAGVRPGTPVEAGLQAERFEGAQVFALPNPSGRNAHHSYDDMVRLFGTLAAFVRQWPRVDPAHDGADAVS